MLTRSNLKHIRKCQYHPDRSVAEKQIHCMLGCPIETLEYDKCDKCYKGQITGDCDYPCLCLKLCENCNGLGFHAETKRIVVVTGPKTGWVAPK